jgi:hypothetical protein
MNVGEQDTIRSEKRMGLIQRVIKTMESKVKANQIKKLKG